MESSVWGITMILLKNIYYEWEDGRTALKNINLEIRKGEFQGKVEVVKALLEV